MTTILLYQMQQHFRGHFRYLFAQSSGIKCVAHDFCNKQTIIKFGLVIREIIVDI